MRRFLFLFPLLLTTPLLAQEYYYNNKQKVQLTPIESNTSTPQIRSSMKKIRYFETPNKQIVGVGDEIILKTQEIQKVLARYDLTLISELSQDLYLLRVRDSSELFTLSNTLYEDSEVEFAHPNFQRKVQKR